MSVLKPAIKPGKRDYTAHSQAMKVLVDDLKSVLAGIEAGGDERARARHQERGKLLARERIRRLLDEGAEFL